MAGLLQSITPDALLRDLRPESILLDRNRLKLSNLDCTAEIGTDYEAYGFIWENTQ
jgi:hypothetical protein